MKHLFKIGLFLFFIIIAVGCSDDPSSTGSGLLPDEDLIGMEVFDTDSITVSMTSSFFEDSLDVSSSDKLLVGKNSYATSVAFVKFYVSIPDSIATQIEKDSIIVRNCWVTINPNYILGNSNGSFDFHLYKVNEDWDATGINRENLSSISIDKSVDISSNRVISDTLITFNIKNSIALKWLLNGVDSTKGENYGVYFTPTSGTNKFMGLPALTSSSILDEFGVYIEVEKIGKYLDTLYASSTEDVHVVEYNNPTSTKNNIFMMGGAAIRSQLYFDLSSLPKNIVVNKAILSLYIDSTETLQGTPASDTVYAIILDDSTSHSINTYYDIGVLYRNNYIYSGDVASIIQRWSDGLENQGFRLNLSNEANCVNKVAIGGSKSTTYKPKLKIIYTNRK